MRFFLAPKKSLGQNFLIDQNIINKIVNVKKIKKNSTIVEIGPGYGSLTKKILGLNPKKLILIEKDKKLSIFLKKQFAHLKNIKVINQDILNEINYNNVDNNIIVFGNLPYNISTKVLTSLILIKKWPPWYESLIFMFQKEVADRIIAKHNTKQFGRLSVISNWRLDVTKHFEISKNCFSPSPKVNSTLLSFKPKSNIYKIKNPENLEIVTRILFSNRRKMINKNFKKLFKNSYSVAEELDLDLKKRPGELASEIFYKIAVKYEQLTE
tara:strand:- start:702 stop:1505 length:804 start_codon:yes stop_codon:yes gene_type:complete